MRSHRVAYVTIVINVGILLGCHIWLAYFRSDHYSTNNKDGARRAVRISQWRQGYLEAIDSRRIVLHETSGRGCLNVRQSCAVESAARHNPDRPIQVIMTRSSDNDTGNSTDAWLTVLAHYNNVEVVQIDDEIQYSNNTALHNWFKTRKNAQHNGHHLSDYIRSVTLFKGGGLFLDMDSVITIKPLTWSKWNNFFVVKPSGPNNKITVRMLHLLHGHHLIDEIILNVAKADATDKGILGAAIDASVNKICGGDGSWNIKMNQCLDVRLIDEEDAILPPFDSLSLSLLIHSKEGDYNVMKKAIVNHGAVLMQWDSMAGLDRNRFDSMYLALMEEHCPFTLVNAKHFPTFHSSPVPINQIIIN